MELEINNPRKHNKFPKIWALRCTLLNPQWIKVDTTREVRKYLRQIKMNTQYCTGHLKMGKILPFFFFYHNRNQMEELHNNKKVCKIQISLFFFGGTKIHFAFIARSGVLLVSSDNLLSRPCWTRYRFIKKKNGNNSRQEVSDFFQYPLAFNMFSLLVIFCSLNL